jgi:CBS domain-containing protein
MVRGDDDQPERIVRLLERKMRTMSTDGAHAEKRTVHCPLKGTQSVDSCLGCARLEREASAGGHEFLECRVPAGETELEQRVGALISEDLTCLDSELLATRALALLDSSGVTSAPVVDDNSVLVGMVSASKLVRLKQHPELEVDDALVTQVVTVPETATVREVAQVMSRHGLDRVPVVTEDGHLVGVVTALDVVRWFAR